MNIDLELARHNMIDSQVRPWDVVDPTVLVTLGRVRREDFVPAAWRNLAFADLELPLGHGEVMMKPVVEGRLLQSLGLTAKDSVLEIGTGSGYLTACLATLAGEVHSVECHADLAQAAQQRLEQAQLRNVQVHVGNALQDFSPKAAVDVLVVTGAVDTLPERMLAWLKPGGRAFFIRGRSPVMQAVLVHREGERSFREQNLFDTDLPYLVHAAPKPSFQF